ncbi:Cytochrome [Sulfitobacter noctilucicola]|uniref:Cytochrome b561/polyisoprenoid-binding protein YceI n=1 Tax=Sulfitobacter noctilucicola TaxID=1342301 RepID=A0A7W6MAW3_9RHOB|nr:cytochrome b/b6 domain-containing protein [Sulfitobacter noctilucicola]KIN66288.1 Cytochrome [Sulfitobacter noctilucicola]MBB4175639.1 cytochrome b561/polyisoprenoid-binding protein YceI [Sulfitobacter noctilucicola]
MAFTNTDIRYGGVTKTFHWLTALLILTLLPLGLFANDLPYQTDAELARKAWYFSVHKTLGVTAFFVAALRILWAIGQVKPGLLNADKPAESFAAEMVHWLLYASLVIVPLSGWIGHAAAEGFAPIWWPFGQNLPLVPKSVAVEHFFAAIHWVATKVLALSLLLHIAGALKHHFIDGDAILRRMLPGEPVIGPLPPESHSKAPVIVATVIWAAALGLGATFGLAQSKEQPAQVSLEQVASDWNVQEGEITLTVTQFGNEVSGSFADWTAAITFDETIVVGDVGAVQTTVAIPSLTLGSVTQQAMGADFLDANTFPTAVFDAILRHGSDDYEAVGTLTIKDQSVPVVLPFSLTIEGDTAQMRGDVTLDRRNFTVGTNVNDEATLAFDVAISIRLTAVREGD